MIMKTYPPPAGSMRSHGIQRAGPATFREAAEQEYSRIICTSESQYPFAGGMPDAFLDEAMKEATASPYDVQRKDSCSDYGWDWTDILRPPPPAPGPPASAPGPPPPAPGPPAPAPGPKPFKCFAEGARGHAAAPATAVHHSGRDFREQNVSASQCFHMPSVDKGKSSRLPWMTIPPRVASESP